MLKERNLKLLILNKIIILPSFVFYSSFITTQYNCLLHVDFLDIDELKSVLEAMNFSSSSNQLTNTSIKWYILKDGKSKKMKSDLSSPYFNNISWVRKKRKKRKMKRRKEDYWLTIGRDKKASNVLNKNGNLLRNVCPLIKWNNNNNIRGKTILLAHQHCVRLRIGLIKRLIINTIMVTAMTFT